MVDDIYIKNPKQMNTIKRGSNLKQIIKGRTKQINNNNNNKPTEANKADDIEMERKSLQ